jgi:HlyD family secretion protein
MMTHSFAMHWIAKRRWAWLASVLFVGPVGCSSSTAMISPPASKQREVRLNESAKSNQVLAQGRIQPAKGLIRLAAIPGDRVEQVLVHAGESIRNLQPLIVLQSQKLRALELEAAELRLDEARAMRQVKQQEADLAIDAAGLKMQSATQMIAQANSQLAMAKKGGEQVDSLGRQISSLQKLRELPLTRAAIGTIELESKKNELTKFTSINEQTLLAAEQAVEISKLQILQSERALAAAKESRRFVDQATPIASLEKQIEILKLQLEQSNIVSPLDGIVVSVNVEVGERTAQLPLFELADLSRMVCVAEVHESDVASIAIDDRVEIRSSALGRSLKGRVQRIDRVVGAAQMRSPNPMARSDFRSIPVWIAIDPSDTEVAAERLQLQVDVLINKTR